MSAQQALIAAVSLYESMPEDTREAGIKAYLKETYKLTEGDADASFQSITNFIAERDRPVLSVVPEASADAAGATATHAPPQPQAVFVDPLSEAPAAMKAKVQWVRWKLEMRSGKPTKVPYQVSGALASSNDPNTWTDYQTAVTGAIINHEQGVGFMFADGFAGIDLDGCRDPKTEDIMPWAQDIIDALDGTYVETSPSGTGLHVFVLGKVPGTLKKFNLNPAIGCGGKAPAIEIYDSGRYFTVTGQAPYDEAGDTIPCDLTAVYQMFHDLRAANPAPRNERAEAADAGESTPITFHGHLRCSKYDIFMGGTIVSPRHPFVITNGIGTVEYLTPSEADMAFATVAAIVHDGDADKVWNDYTRSALVRDKWLEREADFRKSTIAKAVDNAAKRKTVGTYDVPPVPPASVPVAPVVPPVAVTPVAPVNTGELEEKDIPAYNPAIESGFVKQVVDAVCNGTTIPRQFARNVVQAFVGAYMSDVLRFDNLDCNSSRYAVNIAATGTGKRLVWERAIAKMFPVLINQDSDSSVKVFDSADSGAGLRDAFFEKPKDAPVFLMIDEAASLGNRSAESKNPEIVDAIIELADSTTISRVKSKKSQKVKSTKVHENARLSLYMCGQTGEVISLAFQGRKKQGIRERLVVEYSAAIEPGDLPDVPGSVRAELTNALIKLRNNPLWTSPISMADDAKQAFAQYWQAQPDDVRTMVRLRKNLLLDIYLRAFSRDDNVATLARKSHKE